MKDNPHTMTRSPGSNPGTLSKVLWWFSTAIPESIVHSESDRYRAKIIGLGVMFTWIYASIAWIYLWSTNIESAYISIPLGLFIGFGILTIDRMLIASISKFRKNLVAIGLRVVLALFLGAFIAQPLILWMFSQDIDSEIALIKENKVLEKQSKLEEIYNSEKNQLHTIRNGIENEMNRKYQSMQAAETDYLEEIDGTGGSQRYGIAGVAARKELVMNRAKNEYESNLDVWRSELDSVNTRLSQINFEIDRQTADFRNNDLSSGFLIRVEALMSLFSKDSTGALKKRYYLILVILVIFELIPIISKLFLQSGSYDDRIKIRDEIELQVAYANREHEMDLKKRYNELARDADMKLIEEVFSTLNGNRLKRINSNISKWDEERITTFDELWDKIKSDVMTRQEN